MFLFFLAFMILCCIALSVVVILDASGKPDFSKAIQKDDIAAKTRWDLLNSISRTGSKVHSGCESTVILMRHCDKTTDADGVTHHDGNSYCSWVGRERAFFFADLFAEARISGSDPNNTQPPPLIPPRWPAPSKIFALTDERIEDDDLGAKSHYREIETVMPLAHKFGLDIDVYGFDVNTLAADYFELLQSGDMCGKVTVVSWKHETIPDLAFALACGPAQGCPYTYPEDTFDEVWQLKFVFDAHGASKNVIAPMSFPVATQGPLSLFDYPANVPTNVVDNEDDDDDDDDDGRGAATDAPPQRRYLKKYDGTSKHKKHHGKLHEAPQPGRVKTWSVYGQKTYQHFDPLHYSMLVGDYPPGGSKSGGKWDEM